MSPSEAADVQVEQTAEHRHRDRAKQKEKDKDRNKSKHRHHESDHRRSQDGSQRDKRGREGHRSPEPATKRHKDVASERSDPAAATNGHAGPSSTTQSHKSTHDDERDRRRHADAPDRRGEHSRGEHSRSRAADAAHDRDRHRPRDRDRDRDRNRDRDRYRDRDRNRDQPAADRRPRDADAARESSRREREGQQRAEAEKRDAAPSKRDSSEEAGEVSTEGAPARETVSGEVSAPQQKPGAAAGPKSLEDVLRRKQEAEAEAAKPKFMSRKEREALALERRKQQVQAQRSRVDTASIIARAPAQAGLNGASAGDRGAGKDREKEDKAREKQLQLIRDQYLGVARQKRKIAKASDKFRFHFDWDAKEDTFEPTLHEGGLLFGRGLMGGADVREQRQALAQHERKLLNKMRADRGELTTAEDVKADMHRAARAALDDDPLLKEKHWSEKKREDMKQRDWRIFMEDHRINYKNAGKNAPRPFRTWKEMPLPPSITKAIDQAGYTMPTPIQMASIPFGLRQRDVIGLAETGSGKTAAFVIPMLIYIMDQPDMTEAIAADGPYALVMAPTRELAQQIEAETRELAGFTEFRTACIVGGASYEEQIGNLRRGIEICVATPGRLLDCIGKSYAVLNQCNYVVLDEADRMIDLGFEPQVMDVLAAMPAGNLKPWEEEAMLDGERVYRTTYMFSATMPPAVERIARRYLRRPVVVTVGSAGRATDNVKQVVEWVDAKQKPEALRRTLATFQMELEHKVGAEDNGNKIIVFVNNRDNSEDVYSYISELGKYHVALLHGGKSQEQREESIKGFRDGTFDVMLATDVAGRGIDVSDVGLVVNYDMPHTIENYTHRIGRTGRAGRRGTAVTFLTESDGKTFYDLKMLLEESKAHVPHQLANHEKARIKPGGYEGSSRKDTTLYAA